MYEYEAKFLKAIDGDTADFECGLGFYMWARIRFRFLGINTPERGQPGYQEALNYVHQALSNADRIVLTSKKTEKYGRWLAAVSYVPKGTTEAHNLNKELVDQGLAKVYMAD